MRWFFHLQRAMRRATSALVLPPHPARDGDRAVGGARQSPPPLCAITGGGSIWADGPPRLATAISVEHPPSPLLYPPDLLHVKPSGSGSGADPWSLLCVTCVTRSTDVVSREDESCSCVCRAQTTVCFAHFDGARHQEQVEGKRNTS